MRLTTMLLTRHKLRVPRLAFLLTMSLATSFALPALVSAGDDDFSFQKRRIEHLQNMARQLDELRMGEEAQHMRQRARHFTNELEELIARDRRARENRDVNEEEVHAALEGLELAHELLGKLGLRDHQEQVERAFGAIERKLEKREHQRAERRNERSKKKHAENDEIAAARNQLEVLRVAFKALEGRPDAHELMEHAIHVRELNLERRRDDEANRIRKSGPSRGQQAELLMLAAEILKDRGQKERAQMLRKYGRQLAEQDRRIRARGDDRRRETDRPKERRRETGDSIRELRRELETLQKQLRELRGKARQPQQERRRRGLW